MFGLFPSALFRFSHEIKHAMARGLFRIIRQFSTGRKLSYGISRTREYLEVPRLSLVVSSRYTLHVISLSQILNIPDF